MQYRVVSSITKNSIYGALLGCIFIPAQADDKKGNAAHSHEVLFKPDRRVRACLSIR